MNPAGYDNTGNDIWSVDVHTGVHYESELYTYTIDIEWEKNGNEANTISGFIDGSVWFHNGIQNNDWLKNHVTLFNGSNEILNFRVFLTD